MVERNLYVTFCVEQGNRGKYSHLLEELSGLGVHCVFADPEPHHGVIEPTLMTSHLFYEGVDNISRFMDQRKRILREGLIEHECSLE